LTNKGKFCYCASLPLQGGDLVNLVNTVSCETFRDLEQIREDSVFAVEQVVEYVEDYLVHEVKVSWKVED